VAKYIQEIGKKVSNKALVFTKMLREKNFMRSGKMEKLKRDSQRRSMTVR